MTERQPIKYWAGYTGTGTEVHGISEYGTLCGSGKCTTGTRHKSGTRGIPDGDITCTKCLKKVVNNPYRVRLTREEYEAKCLEEQRRQEQERQTRFSRKG